MSDASEARLSRPRRRSASQSQLTMKGFSMSPVSACRRLALVATATVAAIAMTTSAAAASQSASGCPAAELSNPFAAWADRADYQLAPDGDVEAGGTSWSLTGGAGAAEGNETFRVGASGDHLFMRLPGSSSAATPRMCIGVESPSYRLFVKRNGGSAASRLVAEVVYDDAAGDEVVVPSGTIYGSGAWAPSQSLPTVVNVLAPQQGNAIDVSLRFTAVGGGVWSVDDVYVDPFFGR